MEWREEGGGGERTDGGEGHHHCDGLAVVVPVADVVAQPVADFCAGAGEGRAGYDHGSEGWATCFHGPVAGYGHHGALIEQRQLNFKSNWGVNNE